MTLYFYCILVDDGPAPNPYWGVCTLTICKPAIRRTAKVGDWVIGIGSKNVLGNDYSSKLVYAMQVTQILTIKEYEIYCRRELSEKIRNIESKDDRKKLRDCLYDYSENRRGRQRAGVHPPAIKKRDLSGKNALLSDHFFYFGNRAVDIPKEFSILIRQGQGHQCHKNEGIKLSFIDWLTSSFSHNKLYGEPQIQLSFSKDGITKSCSSTGLFGGATNKQGV